MHTVTYGSEELQWKIQRKKGDAPEKVSLTIKEGKTGESGKRSGRTQSKELLKCNAVSYRTIASWKIIVFTMEELYSRICPQ
ncbi:hypothetical protein JTB14_005187 [Gonioctena quinquepunctata]|nr:hypothetical protein JTB14_005187 [Gonioctena quinquepunctata]